MQPNALSNPAVRPWFPVRFCDIQGTSAGSPHPSFGQLHLPQVESGKFLTVKDIRKLAAGDPAQQNLGELEAQSRHAWDHRPFALTETVTRDACNFMGPAFGGNIIRWYMQAGLGAAAAAHDVGPAWVARSLSSKFYTSLIRRCEVNFDAPILEGDQVRCFVEQLTHTGRGLAWNGPFSSTCQLRLAVLRHGGVMDTPLSIMEVGTARVTINHTPSLRHRGDSVPELGPFDISRLVENKSHALRVESFKPLPSDVARRYRAEQIAAGADIACWLFAGQQIGERDNRIVTRRIQLDFNDAAYRKGAPSAPLELRPHPLPSVTAKNDKTVIEVRGDIGPDDSTYAQVAATMVAVKPTKTATS